jgi:hypothetical protein
MAGPSVQNKSLWAAMGILAAFWIMALAVALTDIDFFSLQDLFDTHDLHHEHIVVTLLFVGIVGALWVLIMGRRRVQW